LVVTIWPNWPHGKEVRPSISKIDFIIDINIFHFQ
jgi:hypothetical protein